MAAPVPTGSTAKSVDLQTLVATVGNAVQAQNLIATNVSKVTAELVLLVAAFTSFLATYPVPLTGSASWTPGLIANAAQVTTTITVTGAAIGNFVEVSYSNDLQALTLTGYVSAVNTVTAVLANLTGGSITPVAGTVKARVTTV